MKILLGTGVAVILVLVAYLLLWPVPIDPVSWNAPENNGYAGDFAPNERLATPKLIGLAGYSGPEDAVLGPDGLIYVATRSGAILKVDLASGIAAEFAQTDGRPLGLEFGSDGRLYVADAYRGLLSIEDDSAVSLLSDQTSDGSAIRYANDVDVAASGIVYFSDASTKFIASEQGGTLEASILDLMEHGPNGRILKYDPSTGATDVILDGLSFANGVALADDETSLLISETGTYSILKLWLAGDKAGEVETITANLPGFPDNINRVSDGTYWFGLASPRSAIVDALSDRPFLRKVVQRFPAFLRPKAQRYGFVARMDKDGKILETVQGPQGYYALTTGAILGPNGELVISSLTEPRLAYLEAGWDK